MSGPPGHHNWPGMPFPRGSAISGRLRTSTPGDPRSLYSMRVWVRFHHVRSRLNPHASSALRQAIAAFWPASWVASSPSQDLKIVLDQNQARHDDLSNWMTVSMTLVFLLVSYTSFQVVTRESAGLSLNIYFWALSHGWPTVLSLSNLDVSGLSLASTVWFVWILTWDPL